MFCFELARCFRNVSFYLSISGLCPPQDNTVFGLGSTVLFLQGAPKMVSSALQFQNGGQMLESPDAIGLPAGAISHKLCVEDGQRGAFIAFS